MNSLLCIKELSAGYGRTQVLWDVSLDVPEGEIVSLIGSNGAGKTTLLRAISGFIRPMKGEILLSGVDLTVMSPHDIVRAGVSQVPQGRQLFPKMTVRENLEMGSAYLAEARQHADDTMDWVFSLFPRLKERMDQNAGTMSGGEQQMLAIGRALMARPKLLMVDEPSLGLAPNLVAFVFDVVQMVNREGVSVLLVEQNVRSSLKVASHAYVLENGRVALEGEGLALLDDPHVRRVYLGV